jgi:hypothetical protein
MDISLWAFRRASTITSLEIYVLSDAVLRKLLGTAYNPYIFLNHITVTFPFLRETPAS